MHKRQRTRQNLLLMTAAVSLISICSQALAATAEDLHHDATRALQRLLFAPQAPRMRVCRTVLRPSPNL